LDELQRLHQRREQKAGKIDPARIAPLPEPNHDAAQLAYFRSRGEEAYRGGSVAFLVVAGGQGTRLGFDKAKGLYPVGPITGGTLTGLADSGLLDRLDQQGIRTVYYFQVDNPMTDLGDQVFVGRHLAEDAEVSTKVLPKVSPTEAVGNVVLLDGKCAIIEYSD